MRTSQVSGGAVHRRCFALREMAVAFGQAVAMVYDDLLAVAVLPAGLHHRAVRRRDDRRAGRRGNVLAGVELAWASAEGVAADAEAVAQVPFDGPDRGHAVA